MQKTWYFDEFENRAFNQQGLKKFKEDEMTKTKLKSGIKDIFNGNILQIWEDEGWVYVSFPWAVLNFPKENWDEIKEDFLKIGEQ